MNILKASQHGCKKIVCASGGNAGLAAAFAAKILGIPATIVLPESTPSFVADKLRDEVRMSAGCKIITFFSKFKVRVH